MLNGELVSLRELENKDLKQLFLWHENEHLYLFKGRFRFVSREDLEENFLNYSYSQKIFIISSQKTPIGITSYWNEDRRSRTCEFYARIYEKIINCQTYLFEALRLLVRFLFITENLHRIYTCISDPLDEIKPVLDRLGLLNEGTLRDHRRFQGRYVDTQLYGQLADEWHKLNA